VSRLCVAFLALLVAVPGAAATDRGLLNSVDRQLGPTLAASRAGASGSPDAVQLHYDRARDLQEAIRRSAPWSESCRAYGGWATRYASAEVSSAEGFDRLEPATARRFRNIAAHSRQRMSATRRGCRPRPVSAAVATAAFVNPRPGAASFGEVVVRAPSGAQFATLYANGALAGPMRIEDGFARAVLNGGFGELDFEVRFEKGTTPIGTARVEDVWLLPESARVAVKDAELDAAWQTDVRQATQAFSGTSGVWVHDLASGRSASWNAGARFPAASTVKLGLLVEALRRTGPQPEHSMHYHDIAAIAEWSSNLATNRLLRTVAGPGAVQRGLRRMGATSSTFTGEYIVATARTPVDAPDPPPRVSQRVTTARDLGVLMTVLHRAARGDADALAVTRMSKSQARLALGLLISSEARSDNLGLFREAIGPSTVAAQKHGWISSARHSAAVVYTSRGPVVVVALTYRPGVRRSEAAVLGSDLIRLAAPPMARSVNAVSVRSR
jgi:beta-lactamase class A